MLELFSRELATTSVPRSAIACAALGVALAAIGAASGGGADYRRHSEACGRSAIAKYDGRDFDATMGRDPQNYPPDPQVDFLHLKLELRFEDPLTRSFTATETLTFRTLGRPIDRLELDAVDLQIQAVSELSGTELRHGHDGKRLTVRFPAPIGPDTEHGLVIRYACREPQSGMIFALPDEGYPDRPLMIHTQGQAEMNRYWFAAHDSPNERSTIEVICEAPARYRALSNGALLGRTELAGGMARTHYRLDQPQPAYLVSLVLGEFEVVSERWNDVLVEYWVPPGQSDRATRTLGKTPKMLDTFSRVLDFPYPYPKYAQSIVYLFAWGGMENTTVTTLYETALLDERAALDQDIEGLIAHELAHQWFGDMITCRSWAHLWLNEGFATYFEFIWNESEHGPDRYVYDVWKQLREVAETDPVSERGGLFYPYYEHPDDTFDRGASNPYSKGAAVVHLLRRELGDELFWRCIRAYVKERQWHSVESHDLRSVIEEQSGRSFEQFFQQWVNRPGAPHLRVAYEWSEERSEASVRFEQTQEISAERPAFALRPCVWFVMETGETLKHSMDMPGRHGRIVARLANEPKQALVDPEIAILAKFDIQMPDAMRRRIALQGLTPGSRLRAIYDLAASPLPESREALVELLRDATRDWTQRREAAAALGRMATPAARDALLAAFDSGIAEHRTRLATVEALGEYRHPRVAAALLKGANSDASSAVEAAAIRGLGKQAPQDEIRALLLEKAKQASWEDKVREAAVAALGELADEGGLEAALALARYGAPYRSRPVGIAATAKLLPKAEDAAEIKQLLLAWAVDSQDKAASAALDAIVEVGDPNMAGPLERLANGAVTPQRRKDMRDALARLASGQERDAQIEELRERVRKLEQFREQQERDSAAAREPTP